MRRFAARRRGRAMNIANHPVSRAAVAREFSRISAGPYQLYLRADLAPHAAALAVALGELGRRRFYRHR